MNHDTKNDNQNFTLRPASPDEVGLFYSSEKNDAELGVVGHLRLDFGHQGTGFWSTWWEHGDNELNTPVFKAELEAFVNEMRVGGPLQNLREMQSYCYTHGGDIAKESQHHGYIAESEQYRYCLRCTPVIYISMTSTSRSYSCSKSHPNRAWRWEVSADERISNKRTGRKNQSIVSRRHKGGAEFDG